MAEHAELLADMATIGRLSATERLKHAQKRRAQQLKGWAQMEDKPRANKADQKADGLKKSRNVTFPTNITLLEAAARNDIEEVRQLLNKGVSPDLFNEDGLTALHQCCIDDFVDMARCLLDMGASVNVCDSELWTPLHAAATCGHTDLVQLLLEAGADLLAVNADGNMPYDLCEDEATLEVIEMMMAEQGVTQERIDECRRAKEREMLRDLQEVLANGADLNVKDQQGATLLHIAAANGYVSVGELLLENKVSPDDRDADGWTALHAAACWGHMQMVEMLVAHGASLNAKSELDETPLDVCADEEVRAKMIELKHKHDAIMKGQDKHKNTLQRLVSSTGSRGKVVRRTSVNERSSLYRREHQKEAIVWQERGRQTDVLDDDEDGQTDAELNLHAALVLSSNAPPIPPSEDSVVEMVAQDAALGNGSTAALSFLPGEPQGGGRMDKRASYQLAAASGNSCGDNMSRERSHHTLADLKRQRAAAKLQKHPAPPIPLTAEPRNELLGEEPITVGLQDPLEAPSSVQQDVTPSAVYFTPASGDPPLLKLRAPEEDTSNTKEPCCGLM
ncbi:protein phosphatase 1 regulatory subunit 16A [Xyrauchen texanus]|uniref:protein phosphatase 1 regulatory subunit 16A n=1 Tax=Xyrauchen texanus TaxID=154827 RepID=UPI002241B61A|nr:protein phosphatase 1 regulatory subunit 16A [Xyrauchen texanus]XP_051958904.1 protein phosphatase 1 regulatory subunit 16A [Xyrauchen texanus]XP_051958905.1 protein phosphatase 1 regulatory subunit 16A [Xyrauchen texanus]XP_051958906.1 protein phosphatase 1 regulatory subunit 16A [Xyrauchen texanus]